MIYPDCSNIFHVICYEKPSSKIIQAIVANKILFLPNLQGDTPLHILLRTKEHHLADALMAHSEEIFPHVPDETFHSLSNIFKELLETHSIYLDEFFRHCVGDPDISQFYKFPRLGKIKSTFDNKKFLISENTVLTNSKISTLIKKGDEPIRIKVCKIKMNFEKTSRSYSDLLNAVYNCENNDIYRTQIITCLIDYNWIRARKLIVLFLLIYFVYLVLLSACSILAHELVNLKPIQVILLVFNTFFAAFEIIQMIDGIKSYLLNVWNLLDVSRIALLYVEISFLWSDDGNHEGPAPTKERAIMSFLILLSYARGISYLRIFKNMRKLMN